MSCACAYISEQIYNNLITRKDKKLEENRGGGPLCPAPAPSPGSPESAVAACSLSSFPVLLFFFEEEDLNPSEWMRLEISLEARSTTPKQKKI